MKFGVYKQAIVLGLSEITNYRMDMWFQLLSKIVAMAGLAILWRLLLQGKPGSEIAATAGYLLVANGVRELVDAFHLRFAGKLMDEIKDGQINSALVRPIIPYRLSYFIFSGSRGTNIMFGSVLVIAGIIIRPANEPANYLMFLLMLMLANIISYQINIMVSFLTFWFTQASSMRSLMVHTTRVLSGSLVPVSYFPGIIKEISLLSPFPALAYLPAKVLQSGVAGYCQPIIAAMIWIIIMAMAEKKLWNWGLKKYEAVGI